MNKKSNLAYNYDAFEEKAAVRTPQIVEVTKRRPRSSAKSAAVVLRAVFCMTALVIVLFSSIYTRAVQAELNSDYNCKLKELNTIKSENARLQVQIEEELNNDNIEKIAKEQLNMQELDSGKTEYIQFYSVPKCEVIEERSVFEKIKDWFETLL